MLTFEELCFIIPPKKSKLKDRILLINNQKSSAVFFLRGEEKES